MTTFNDLLKRDFDITNVTKYHEQGYKGKGITILNIETDREHDAMTSGVARRIVPESTILIGRISGKVNNGILEFCNLVIDGITYQFEEAIDKFNIKIISASKSGYPNKALLDYYKDIQKRKGVIFLSAAGNEPSQGINGAFAEYNTGITVGALYSYEDGTVVKTNYSAYGDELDFMSPLGGGSGTSASTPFLASMIALLLERYGNFNQEECYEILKLISKDLGDTGFDVNYGFGMPVLPLTEKIGGV